MCVCVCVGGGGGGGKSDPLKKEPYVLIVSYNVNECGIHV